MLWPTCLQRKDELARPVKYHTLTEYILAVAFRPVLYSDACARLHQRTTASRLELTSALDRRYFSRGGQRNRIEVMNDEARS
ncbi:hypothetical protein EVAR_27781_1 [Eumeta japonica]|uniref:Uncharacterized protein n=1 Tax=Eumeta variegata TaxID=151549 RepID=A0A4C1VBF3_EUMVA|nr:hypothetical protein EVAR_27781_1 [Eumeta japonica]